MSNSPIQTSTPIESSHLTPDICATSNLPTPASPDRPRHVQRKSSLSHVLDLTSPLQRVKTPEAAPTPLDFADPKVPTYGKTYNAAAKKQQGSPSFKILLAYDSRDDALLAYQHVSTKLSFTPSDHIYIASILPPAPKISSHQVSPVHTPRDEHAGFKLPSNSNSNSSSALNHLHHGHGKKDSKTDEEDGNATALGTFRQDAMDRLEVIAKELGERKKCQVTPLIVHDSSPAKALVALARELDTDTVVLGRRKLSKLNRVVGAGSVGDYLLQKGFNCAIIQK